MFDNRLKQLREARGFTQADIASEIDITQRAYANYERDEREPNAVILLRIAKFFGVSTDYLLGHTTKCDITSSEQVALNKYRALDEHGKKMVDFTLNEEYDRCVAIAESEPSITMSKHLNKASAGYGYDLNDEDEWKEIKVVDEPAARNADFAVEIEGNSMQPKFNDGDVVFIVYDKDVPIGKVGLFRQNGRGYIKERGEDYLISTNDKFPHIYPEDGEIECIGRVIGIATVID